MRNTASFYGRIAQLTALAGLVTFCLKTDYTKSKVALGMLYFYWSPHVLTLGGHLGMLLKTPWAFKELNMGLNTETGKMTQLFIQKIKQRETDKREQKKVIGDAQFQQDFYIEANGMEISKFFEKSYVLNDYFNKNYDKYAKKSIDDKDSTHIFSPEINYDDRLKVPYLPDNLDCLLTRYIYHNFSRWIHRFSAFLGLTTL